MVIATKAMGQIRYHGQNHKLPRSRYSKKLYKLVLVRTSHVSWLPSFRELGKITFLNLRHLPSWVCRYFFMSIGIIPNADAERKTIKRYARMKMVRKKAAAIPCAQAGCKKIPRMSLVRLAREVRNISVRCRMALEISGHSQNTR